MSGPSRRTRPLSACALVLLAGGALAAPDEERLGKGENYPVCPLVWGRAHEERCWVGNYTHFDNFVNARKVAKGEAVRTLRRAERAALAAHADAFLGRSRTTALLVLHGDTILWERYQYERKPDHRFTSMSMAKTVVAALVGIALAEGKLHSIEDLSDRYVSELKGHPYGQSSLRSLLSMTSGVRFRELQSFEEINELSRLTFYAQGTGGASTVLPFRDRDGPPGWHFNYSSGDTQVLALALQRATGRPLAEYLSEKIWKPMGAEADATWLLDPAGMEFGFAGIQATLRDWGRLGLLLADYGSAGGKEILPRKWVQEMTREQIATRSRLFPAYGYQTWVAPGGKAFALLGVRGQATMVDPEKKIVVVMLAVDRDLTDAEARSRQWTFFDAVRNELSN